MFPLIQGRTVTQGPAAEIEAPDEAKPRRKRPDRSGRKRKADIAGVEAPQTLIRDMDSSQPRGKPNKRQKATENLGKKLPAVNKTSSATPLQERQAPRAKRPLHPQAGQGPSQQVQVHLHSPFFSSHMHVIEPEASWSQVNCLVV